ncbi:hypothetical protein DL93DRAFT_2081973 [Clavulina sp. PMI_390]|nr:hypothetical protein DL93DRAFT_2081973 [Clavulina sp. PMI_390]
MRTADAPHVVLNHSYSVAVVDHHEAADCSSKVLNNWVPPSSNIPIYTYTTISPYRPTEEHETSYQLFMLPTSSCSIQLVTRKAHDWDHPYNTHLSTSAGLYSSSNIPDCVPDSPSSSIGFAFYAASNSNPMPLVPFSLNIPDSPHSGGVAMGSFIDSCVSSGVMIVEDSDEELTPTGSVVWYNLFSFS